MATKKDKQAQAATKKRTPVKYTDTPGQPMMAAEPEAVYGYRPFYSDDISLLSRSKKGLNPKAALDFLLMSGFTQDEFQETFKTTVKTIQNHVTKDLTLDASLSEKLLKSFALFDKGAAIFGSASNFHKW